jgi:hypothetical protein
MSLLCDWKKRLFSRARAVLPQRSKQRRKGLGRQEQRPGVSDLDTDQVVHHCKKLRFIPLSCLKIYYFLQIMCRKKFCPKSGYLIDFIWLNMICLTTTVKLFSHLALTLNDIPG